MSILSALVFHTPGDRLTRVISVAPPCSTWPISPYPNLTRVPSEPNASYSLLVKIDENYPIQSVQHPLLISLGLEPRIWMKGDSFRLSLVALILKNKGVRNYAQ